MLDGISMRAHTLTRVPIPRYMRAAQQQMAKDGVGIIAIRLMSCQIRSKAIPLIGRVLRVAQPPTFLGVLDRI